MSKKGLKRCPITQVMDSNELEDDLKSYSINDLKQLKELITQSYEHYAKMMADEKLTSSLKEGDLMALRLCHEETKKELDEIEQEIASRR
jgi:hypothetical protein